MIVNWWSLWHEWRKDGRECGHHLLTAREGFALPDVRFWPTETTMEVTWQPLDSPSAGVSFLSGGNEVVPKPVVRQEFCRLIQSVLERLESRKVPDSYLAEEWAAIQSAEQDPEQRAFCERAARLGCDPFAMDDQLAHRLEQVGSLLPDGLLDDFCDSIQTAEFTSASQAVEDFLAKARSESPAAGRWSECAAQLQKHASSIPWKERLSAGPSTPFASRSAIHQPREPPDSTGTDGFVGDQALGTFWGHRRRLGPVTHQCASFGLARPSARRSDPL